MAWCEGTTGSWRQSPLELGAPLQLCLARFGRDEGAGLERGPGAVLGEDGAAREGARLDQLQPLRRGPGAEQAPALAQQQREGPDAEAVDQVLGDQRLQQAGAAVDLQLRSLARLQPPDRVGDRVSER
jgi:hypothetical protein